MRSSAYLFSIGTPTLGRSAALLRCLASVADQAGVEVEHVVQEKAVAGRPPATGSAGQQNNQTMKRPTHESTDSPRRRRHWFSEDDTGIYDALNRGFARATGELCGWLNDDEQYLPDALARVAQAAAENPAAEIFFGGAVVVNAEGQPLAWRRTAHLRFACVAAAHLYTLSCALFFRRRLWERLGGFDAGLRIVGDEDFIGRALRAGASAQPVPGFLGSYTVHPGQISAGVEAARRELAILKRRWPPWTQRLIPVLKAWRRLEDAAHGWWPGRSLTLDCALYRGDDLTRRVTVQARCNGRWPGPVWE